MPRGRGGRGGRGYKGRKLGRGRGRNEPQALSNARELVDWTRMFAKSAQSSADAQERRGTSLYEIKTAKEIAKDSWDAVIAANVANDALKRVNAKFYERISGEKPSGVKPIKGISLDCTPNKNEKRMHFLGAKKIIPRKGDEVCKKCGFTNFGSLSLSRGHVCIKCGVKLPVQRNKDKSDLSLEDAFSEDGVQVFLITLKYLEMANVARLACVCRDLRDLMKDPLIWTELMCRYLSSNCYKGRLYHLQESSVRKPAHIGACDRVKLIVKNETSLTHEVWCSSGYPSRMIKTICPGQSTLINTHLGDPYAFVPTEEEFVGSNAGVAMRVLGRSITDVSVWGKKIRGVEWILRPRKPQPIKGTGKRYTQAECAQYILSDRDKPTVKAYRNRAVACQKKVDKLTAEIEAMEMEMKIKLERLENLRTVARREVGSAKYAVEVLTKTTQ